MKPFTAFVLFLGVVLAMVLFSRLRPARSEADKAIILEISGVLSREFPLAGIQVDVKAFDGAVILGGFVREQHQLERAVQIARATPGVKSVESRISVKPAG